MSAPTSIKLAEALKALDIKRPFRKSETQPSFQAPDNQSSFKSTERAISSPRTISDAIPPTSECSSNREQTVSNFDTVKNFQTKITNKNAGRVSVVDTVKFEQCSPRTVSKMDTVAEVPQKTGFTPIPNYLLRGSCAFSEPVDFMVYMHMLSLSLGFHRDWATVSQAQLERFTGASKNTIKRSLERIGSLGLIEIIDEYEHGRVSRRWKINVKQQCERRETPTLSKTDTVQSSQYQNLIQTLSEIDTLTVSKFDTYKERNPKENIKKIISSSSVNSIENHAREVMDYLSTIKAPRKMTSELDALGELSKNYSQEQIAVALEYILQHGSLHDKTPCHSPLKYLCSAMDQVLKLVDSAAESKRAREAREAAIVSQKQFDDRLSEAAEKQAQERELAFIQAYPSEAAQLQAIEELLPLESRLLPARIQRALAIGKFSELKKE